MIKKKMRLAMMVNILISSGGPLHLNKHSQSVLAELELCCHPQVSLAVAVDSLDVELTGRQHHGPRLPAASGAWSQSHHSFIFSQQGLQFYRWGIWRTSALPHRTRCQMALSPRGNTAGHLKCLKDSPSLSHSNLGEICSSYSWQTRRGTIEIRGAWPGPV